MQARLESGIDATIRVVPVNNWRDRLASAAVRERVAELERQDGEVRLLRLLLGESRIFEWVLSVGTLRDPVLRTLAPPLPEAALRRITADDAPEAFLWTGLVDVETILRLYQGARVATNVPARPRLLDFGCGCGRLLRFLVAHGDLFELHGSDVNPDHVEWCRRHLSPIAFSRNAPAPPLSFPNAFFDCIWALSVFTHIEEDRAIRWRRELARVLAPDGILLATVHGPTALEKIAREPSLARSFRFDHDQIRAVQRQVASHGFAFMRSDPDVLAAARAGDEYGTYFTTPEYVERRWADECFTLAEYLPGGLRGWQDIVVLRRR